MIVIVSVVILLAWMAKKKQRSQKIDNLPVLATCRSGTLEILSSEVNGPVSNGNTR